MDLLAAEELMHDHGVKPTANRVMVARALSDAGRPMTMTELETELATIDKSNIFRALVLFREHHMVHIIEDGDGVRYELCHSHGEEHDEDAHAHFFCESCHRTFCLEDVHIPSVELPEGYHIASANFVIKGLCPECSGE